METDFLWLHTYAIPWLYSWLCQWLLQSYYYLRSQPLESSLGRVPQAADFTCNQNVANRIVSVAEDCLSPERTFHGCLNVLSDSVALPSQAPSSQALQFSQASGLLPVE